MTSSFAASDYPIGRFSARCVTCGKALAPGQAYYAVIWHRQNEYVREDFDEDCWREPTEQPSGSPSSLAISPTAEEAPP